MHDIEFMETMLQQIASNFTGLVNIHRMHKKLFKNLSETAYTNFKVFSDLILER